MNFQDITALILCGGRGTRAYPHTQDLPKPLIDVAGKPMLRHVMEVYATQGCIRFVLAAGFRPDLVADFASDLPADWRVDVIDTGEETNKGDRVLACRRHLSEIFFLTYGDGVGDVNLTALLGFHTAHTGTSTVTVVPLPSQYGTMDIDNTGQVRGFIEKPRLFDHWINAGFFVMDEAVFETWTSGSDLETDVLPTLGACGELYAYRHEGFWKSMDTFKDAQDLAALAAKASNDGRPPWLRSAIPASS